MKLKQIQDENFQDYKLPSMFLATISCDWKCLTEQGLSPSVCQNSHISKIPTVDYQVQDIYSRYLLNPITKAIVIGGLEPMLQLDDIVELISFFRSKKCKDLFIIYTGYYPEEINIAVNILRQYENIIIKFGRYIKDRPKRYDKILGVELASDNQWAVRI